MHTVALLKGAVTGAGWSAAKGLHVALRSGPPAGLQGGAFGKSSVDVLASPFLVSAVGWVAVGGLVGEWGSENYALHARAARCRRPDGWCECGAPGQLLAPVLHPKQQAGTMTAT